MKMNSMTFAATDAPESSKCSWCGFGLHGSTHIDRRMGPPPSTAQRFCDKRCLDLYDERRERERDEPLIKPPDEKLVVSVSEFEEEQRKEKTDEPHHNSGD